VRVFASELTQVTFVLLGASIVTLILVSLLRALYTGNLDIVLPMVMLGAVVWGRLTQTVHQARLLAGRGFGVAAILTGFGALRAESDAERQQLRANPAITGQRRKQVIVLRTMFVATFLMREFVARTMRSAVASLRQGLPGRALLTRFTLRVATPTASQTVPPTRPITAVPRSAPTPPPRSAEARIGVERSLEARVEALEAWRRQISDV